MKFEAMHEADSLFLSSFPHPSSPLQLQNDPSCSGQKFLPLPRRRGTHLPPSSGRISVDIPPSPGRLVIRVNLARPFIPLPIRSLPQRAHPCSFDVRGSSSLGDEWQKGAHCPISLQRSISLIQPAPHLHSLWRSCSHHSRLPSLNSSGTSTASLEQYQSGLISQGK